MKIDYISDLHVDTYSMRHPGKKIGEKLAEEANGEILILAGDIANTYVRARSFFRKIVDGPWRKILFVPGNHDLYLKDKIPPEGFSSLEERLDLYERLLAADNLLGKMELMRLGKIIEIDGIAFAGDPILYGDRYFDFLGGDRAKREELFAERFYSLPYDSSQFDLDDILSFHRERMSVLPNLLSKAEVMISHSLPSCLKRHTNEKWREDPNNCLYCFDGLQFVDKSIRTKYWFYGHVHDPNQWEWEGVKFFCNPYGVQGEHPGFKGLKTVRIFS